MNSDRKFDFFGCVTYVVTSLIALTIGIWLAIKWSVGQTLVFKILIWVGCIFVSGLVGYLTMLAITLPFAYYADKVVANEIEREPERVLTEASKASVWIAWYFKRGTLTLVTAPLFLFLGYCIAISAFGAAIQGLALLRASYAVFGFIGVFMAVFFFGWAPILPPILYYSLMKNLPGTWLRSDISRRTKVFSSLAVIVLIPLAAYLISHGVAWGIGWIADHDPCAAFSAGVTGSKPPVNCL